MKIRDLIKRIIASIRTFFGFGPEKPAPSSPPSPREELLAFMWSAVNLKIAGSLSMPCATAGTAVPFDQATGVQPMPEGQLLSLVVRTEPAPASGLSVLMYRYRNGQWIAGWAPTVQLLAGADRGEIDLSSAPPILPGDAIQCWLALPRLDPVSVFATVIMKQK